MDLKIFSRWIVTILILLFIPQGLVIVTILSFTLLFLGRLRTDQGLLLYFATFFIQSVFEVSENSSNIRLLILVAIVIRWLLFGRNTMSLKFPKLIVVYLIFLLLHSLIFSEHVSYSLIQFGIFGLMIFVAWICSGGKFGEDFNIKVEFINMIYAILILSFLFLPAKEIAFARNGSGFQGVSIHPNAYGVLLAPFCAYVLMLIIKKPNRFEIFAFICLFLSLLLTQSRTSLISMVVGFVVFSLFNKEALIKLKRAFVPILIGVGLVFIFFFNTLSKSLVAFLIKGEGNQDVYESIQRSRGKLFEVQFQNIVESPWFGIGFKIPSNKIVEGEVHSEKGTLLLASLEETGIVGLILLSILLLSLLIPKLRESRESYGLLAIVSIITTLGESTLFSIGGLGIIIWYFIFFNFKYSK